MTRRTVCVIDFGRNILLETTAGLAILRQISLWPQKALLPQKAFNFAAISTLEVAEAFPSAAPSSTGGGLAPGRLL